VLAFTLATAVASGVIFGTFPATSSRVDLVKALKQGTTGAGESPKHRRLRNALVAAQVALSMVLLIGAGLLLTSFFKLQRVNAGYRADHVLTAEAYGNFSRYPDGDALLKTYLPLVERLNALPGVTSAAITNAVPLAGSVPFTVPFQIERATSDDPDRRPTTDVCVASTRYFETLGIPLVRGRVFTDFDERDAPPVAIINRSMMRYWESREPIGSRISIDGGESWATIVGVVGDVRQFGLDREATAQVYAPLRQSGGGFAGRILVRARTDPIELSRAVRDTVHALDPNMPVENVQTLLDLRDQSLATPRLTATLLALFAALALAVTLTGITGVIATSVTERMPEFGIRMALGATRTSVLGRVMAQGLVLIGIG
jgi:predicted permease